MSYPFQPQQGLIVVKVEVAGVHGNAVLRLALDTGATNTLINVALLVAIGYDPALAPDVVQVTTGSGVEFVPRIVVTKLSALGLDQAGFAVLCRTLPTSANVDGLLGLDFFRGRVLSLDFQKGIIELQ